MKKLQLYLETSIWNFYFADDAPEKKDVTLSFFEKIKNGVYEIFISDIVLEEISRAEKTKMQQLLRIISKIKPKRLIVNEEIIELANRYIAILLKKFCRPTK